MNHFYELMSQIGSNPLSSIFLILNIILLEIVLSVDNAAVLATMVKNMPEKMQRKALSYGILGAYVFRGLALVFTSFIIDIWWLKPIGGIYLLWLSFSFFRAKYKAKQLSENNEDVQEINKNWLYKATVGWVGVFWSTVIAIEFVDIIFSIDNIFAVVAFSDNIILIVFGVFIGILAMRFVATRFVKLMKKYPVMETSAFVVIGLLGFKLCTSLLVHFVPVLSWIESEGFDMVISGLTLLIFFVPVLCQKYITKR
jgi:YkoY family integral membrane protein